MVVLGSWVRWRIGLDWIGLDWIWGEERVRSWEWGVEWMEVVVCLALDEECKGLWT